MKNLHLLLLIGILAALISGVSVYFWQESRYQLPLSQAPAETDIFSEYNRVITKILPKICDFQKEQGQPESAACILYDLDQHPNADSERTANLLKQYRDSL